MRADRYAPRARLAPAAIASVPAIALVGSGISSLPSWSAVVGILIGAIGMLACGVVRDLGRDRERTLWDSWGGPPTRHRLQWRRGTDQQAVRRNHELIESVLKGSLPSEEEESASPEDADQAYDAAIARLRELTRDPDRFHLLLEENVEYGFRRNMLGARPIALGVAIATTAVGVGLSVAGQTRFVGVAILALLATMVWTWVVNPNWVRRSAERYATRLFGAAVLLRDASAAQ